MTFNGGTITYRDLDGEPQTERIESTVRAWRDGYYRTGDPAPWCYHADEILAEA